MATFKTCVRKQRADGYWPVYIRVIHNRAVDYIKTDRMIDGKGINSKTGEIKDTFVLKYCLDKITSYIECLNKISYEHWTIKQITSYLENVDEDICFSDFARKYKFEMAKSGMERNARNYELAFQHLERYAGTDKLMFSRFTTKFIDDWIDSMKNTSRAKEMYPICIRQIFKAAIKEYNDYDRGYIRIKTNPWINVKIPSADVPEKRAINPEQVRDFFAAPIPESKLKLSVPELGRDVALMIICLAGINTADIYHLKKENLKDGVIGYNRKKTMKFRRDRAYIEVSLPDILKPLLMKYEASSDSEYLFNFPERYSTEDSFNANVNGGIKDMCKSMGIAKEEQYCSYTFRHTWGTVARNYCGAIDEDVAFAMNHASAHKVTQGYIKPDYSRITILNDKVIEYLFFSAQAEQKKDDEDNGVELRISPKYQIKGDAYFKGRVVAKLCDIGFNNKEEVISALVKLLPTDIPVRSMVQFRIENTDKAQSAIYERMKGKGF